MSFLETDRDLSRQSYYVATAPRTQSFPALEETIDADVAVVGGGLAGMCAALELAERGLSVVLLEAQQVGWGASGRNGGQAIAGLACDQSVIEDQLGLDDARKVWDMSLEAVNLLRERSERHGFDCEWRQGFLGVSTNARKGKDLHEWAERIQRVYNYPLQVVDHADVRQWIDSPRYHNAYYDAGSGHLHPLKYSLGIASAAAKAGVRIYEHSAVNKVVPGQPARVETARGAVKARQVLLAGNVYLQGVASKLESRIMPVGTYIICTKPLSQAQADSLIPTRSAVCDNNFVLDYFRTTNDNRMLYGGRVSYSTVTPMNLAETMRRTMLKTFPQLSQAEVEFAWGGFVDITINRAPDFGRIGPNMYYLQGFSGHGLALTGLAGRVVAEAIAGDAGRFDVFARLKHHAFPGGQMLRTPALVLGTAWYRMRDLLF
ncbi:NAD(P)/FAD-dependent oxidoreductase [Aquabacterium sp.]|uniref:NAD(P)/FAD-dependent oxidoreductase n=1 Tax=Aquabacterium sp. TaxID=1872578 RepID=UPI0035AE62B7